MRKKCIIIAMIFLLSMIPLNAAPVMEEAVAAGPTRMPRIIVFNGNGAYHTSVEGFKTNASDWGYEVFTTNVLEDYILETGSMLILNANDYLSDDEIAMIKTWWDNNPVTVFFAGDSDYGGYWSPNDLNNLSLQLGLDVIIQDDAISDPQSQDGASYRVVANETNSAYSAGLTSGVTNVSMHGPTCVVPYNGNSTGYGNTVPNWGDVAGADWLVNSSAAATVQDQDFDDDDQWEGYTPLSNGSVSMVAYQELGDDKAIWAGEAIFADYKAMFGYEARYANGKIQNIQLVHNLLDWSVTSTPIEVETTTGKKHVVVSVFNGNGAYHTSIEAFRGNASSWGYFVQPITELSPVALAGTDILILNANDYLLDNETQIIKDWWNRDTRAIWMAGDSDYGGYWSPNDLNNLSLQLGGEVIIQDDAISDPQSQDGASYRVIANETNSAWSGTVTNGVTNVSMHGPTCVVPYDGNSTGYGNTVPAWSTITNADWFVNSSAAATVQDQDFDDDDQWEGYTPLSNGSVAMVAGQWGLGPYSDSKLVWMGEAIFADYKAMFGTEARYANGKIQNIPLVHNLLTWSFDNTNAPDKHVPTIYVYNGNGAYHTSVVEFTGNATEWGYNVYATTILSDTILEMTDVLILNANDFLTETDVHMITMWWNMGNRTLWVAGDSDYGGYWSPNDLNELTLSFGGEVIIQDDAISDPQSQDGASYRVVANETNSDWSGTVTSGVTNVSMHGPTCVVPYDGNSTGYGNTVPAWSTIANADWFVNSSAAATVQDQDFDDDDQWEGYTPLSNGSVAMVAGQWGLGPYSESEIVWMGEAIFSDYKAMFGYDARYANAKIQNVQLIHNLLDWSTPSGAVYNYSVAANDFTVPEIYGVTENTFEDGEFDFIEDNENFELTFNVHDFPNAYAGLKDVKFTYSVDDGEDQEAVVDRVSFDTYQVTLGPWDAGTSVEYSIYVEDQTGFNTMTDTASFTVTYSDTKAPAITNVAADMTDVTPDDEVTISATVVDEAEDNEIVSGLDAVTVQYSTDDGTTWTDLAATADGSTYSATLPTFDDGTTVTVQVHAMDMAGNEATSDTLTFDVEAPPVTSTTTSTTTSSSSETTSKQQPAPGFTMIPMLFSLVAIAYVLKRRK